MPGRSVPAAAAGQFGTWKSRSRVALLGSYYA